VNLAAGAVAERVAVLHTDPRVHDPRDEEQRRDRHEESTDAHFNFSLIPVRTPHDIIAPTV
jgi:hypothetical protein